MTATCIKGMEQISPTLYFQSLSLQVFSPAAFLCLENVSHLHMWAEDA